MPLYIPTLAEIESTRTLTALEKWFKIRTRDGVGLSYEPGQFVEVSVFGIGEAPISITSSIPPNSPLLKGGRGGLGNGSIEICVRKVGDVTTALHNLEEGAVIGLRGPFGKGFPLSKMKGCDLLFIAGGLGIAPLRSAINYVLDRRDEFSNITILYGAKTPAEILFADELFGWQKRKDIKCEIAVDKPDAGWTGKAGVITRLVPPLEIDAGRTFALVVGPPIMYKYVLMELGQKKIPETQIYLSLERRMKCGVGKCGHCQINSVYVCQEGPVFSYQTLKFLTEAI